MASHLKLGCCGINGCVEHRCPTIGGRRGTLLLSGRERNFIRNMGLLHRDGLSPCRIVVRLKCADGFVRFVQRGRPRLRHVDIFCGDAGDHPSGITGCTRTMTVLARLGDGRCGVIGGTTRTTKIGCRTLHLRVCACRQRLVKLSPTGGGTGYTLHCMTGCTGTITLLATRPGRPRGLVLRITSGLKLDCRTLHACVCARRPRLTREEQGG